MAREKGTFTQSANYELQKEGTIDARQFVDVFADLLNFTASDYIAQGFPVTVREDSTFEGDTYKKGWYQFLGGALNNKANWEFMGGSEFPPYDPTDLEIGGRNYLPTFHSPEWDIDSGAIVDKYSLHFPANSGNPTAEIILDVESDTNYTFTIETDFARYYIYEYNGGVGDIIYSGSAPKTTFNTGSFSKIRISIDTGSSNRDKDRNVSNLKLEKGTIATDWTPNPEDKADKDEIPDEFVPAEHDLDEFKNQSANPFARMDDLPPPFDPTYLENNIQNLENNKVDKDGDKQLSDENFSNEEKQKLANIEEGAQVNVIPDWDADTSNPRRIDNKPTKTSQFINDGENGTDKYAQLKDIYKGNALLSYGIVNIPGTYQYDVWADKYIINGILYEERIEDTVTLSPADSTYDRIDRIVINTDGDIIVKEGIPAENPVSPDIDPETEVEVRFILVKANTAEPDINTIQVYDENLGSPNEWDSEVLIGVLMDFDNTEFASKGTKSLKFGNTLTRQRLVFSPETPLDISTVDTLLFDIKTATTNPNIETSVTVGGFPPIYISPGNRGFLNDTNWHTISIPIAELREQNPTITHIEAIYLQKWDFLESVWWDNIRFIKDDSGGSPQPVKIQRTSEIPINDGATGDSKYVEEKDFQQDLTAPSTVKTLSSQASKTELDKKLNKVTTGDKEQVYGVGISNDQKMYNTIEQYVSPLELSVINALINADYVNGIATVDTGTIEKGRKYIDVSTGDIYEAFEDDQVIKY